PPFSSLTSFYSPRFTLFPYTTLFRSEIPHAKICVAFTPDEEIAKGTVNFDIEHFGAQYAYTFDGGEIGTLETENFNAATAFVQIDRKSTRLNSSHVSISYAVFCLKKK